MFPANNVWNADISALPVDPNSANYLANMATGTGLHPDFGFDLTSGIPFNVVSSAQAKVSVDFSAGAPTESDNGPYPIPPNPNIESNDLAACSSPSGNGDCHILIVDKDACILYELDAAATQGPGQWSAFSGAIWSLKSNALRTDTWTSADAAGLPILPGLVRFDEVNAGLINHALRFTMVHTQKAHIYPARHDASSNTGMFVPPMGLRVRLKASTNISGLSPEAKVIAQAMKTYGLILADNGSNWYISGVSDTNFNDSDLHNLNQLHGSDFEVVDTSSLRNGPDNSTATVNVGPSNQTKFVDVASGTTTTTIPVNTTVVWNWMSSNHSTTSGSCPGGVCTADGKWDSQVNNVPNTFMQVFNQVGTYPYFCSVHGSNMQGTVIVTPPSDYSLIISNSPLLIFPGQTAAFSGKLTTTNGYNNPVNLSCGAGHPATCTPAPTSQTPTAAGAGFLVNASDVTPGNYTFNVQGIGTDTLQTSHAQSVTLHVVDFNLTAPSPTALTTAVSTNPTTTPTAGFQVSASGSFSGTVTLSCSGLPAGASCNFAPSSSLSFSGAGSQPVTVSITVPGNTAAGVSNATISANTAGAPAAKTQNITLQVVDFAQGLPSPASVPMTQSSVSQPVTFQLAPVNSSGFNAPVTLSCSGVANASCTFSPASPVNISGSGITETVQVTTNNAAVSTPSLTIQSSATVNGVTLNRSQSLTLNISAGGTTTDLFISSVTSQPDPVEARGPVAITVTAHNTGANAGNVVVSLLFSQFVNVINATLPPACSVSNGTVTCTVGILNAGQDSTPFIIQIVPGAGRNLVVTATVSSSSVNDSNINNNSQPVTVHIRFKPLARRGLVPRVP
ncbi:MAG TPA: plastocyanin/azurin family copper-binding protein [Terriglobales bacterium]|jgi:plastocyanin|nr:plastocyanin/azurin family copper-binding protein [Terriglobales bacterium]